MKIYLNAYLQKNLGDDLFVYILLNRYKNHQFYAMSTEKAYRKMYDNLHVLDAKYLVKAIRKLSLKALVASPFDLALTLGGSMFIENPGDIRKNYSFGKKDHYILGVNFGPYRSQRYFDKIKALFAEAKDVCFRERHSYDYFSDLPQTRVESDIVFCLPFRAEAGEEKHAVISVISCKSKLSEEYDARYLETMTALTDRLVAMGYRVTLMSFCDYEGDPGAIDRILCKVQNPQAVGRYDYQGNIEQALQVLGSSSVVVGSRFHANVLGLLMGKTVIPFIYSDKTKNVLEDLGFAGLTVDIRKLDDFDLASVNEEALSYHLDVSQAKASAEKHFAKLDERLLT